MIINLILISSPLQAVVFKSILKRYPDFFNDKNTIIFLEGDYRINFSVGRIFFIKNSKSNVSNLKADFTIVSKYLNKKTNLWISEIFYPLNNAIYKKLLSLKQLNRLHIFDEGMVLYWQNNLNFFSLFRENLKFFILTLITFINFSYISRKPFFLKNIYIIYAINPHILPASKYLRKIHIDLSIEDYFDCLYIEKLPKKNSIIILSQPHYRITTDSFFNELIQGLFNFISEQGINDIFIKMHPSETAFEFNKYYKKYNCRIILEKQVYPIESYFAYLNPSNAIISVNSSALINAYESGFGGNIYSYGLDWLAKQYRYRNLYKIQKEIFLKSHVKVIDHYNE